MNRTNYEANRGGRLLEPVGMGRASNDQAKKKTRKARAAFPRPTRPTLLACHKQCLTRARSKVVHVWSSFAQLAPSVLGPLRRG